MVEQGTSYFGVRDPRHAATDLDRFRERGLDAVLHTFSECDLEYYRGSVEEIVAASHERGFTVYVNPWGVGRVFGGEAFSEFVGRNPGACQVTRSGRRAPSACFNDDRFRAFVRDWTRRAVDIGADVLFWDEPHWYIAEWYEDGIDPDDWTCRCDACRARYREQYGEPMPTDRTERVDAFREASLRDFLDEMMALTHELGARNAVCLLPGESTEHGLTDWERLARSPHLDVIATDPYWTIHADDEPVASFVERWTRRVVDLATAHDLGSQIWIQGFRLEAGATPAVRTATRAALDGGVDSVFLWGYDGCRTVSDIACEEPDAVWEAYLTALE